MISVALLGAGLVNGAGVSMANADEVAYEPCAPKVLRFEEDCRNLRDKTQSGVDRLRYLPLDPNGDWWLQFAGQYRYRVENLDEPNYGLNHVAGYTAHGHRLLASAFLQSTGGFGVFVELGAATEHGRRPVERAFDRSAVDVTQAFVDLPAHVGSWTAGLRLGRQELDSEGNRLLALRDVSNLRRTFDMALASLRDDTRELEVFSGRPVVNFPGAFDDHWSTTETLSGAMGTWRTPRRSAPSSIGFFFLDRNVPRRLTSQETVEERRRTFGLRATVNKGGWSGATQASWQWGTQRERNIRAYGIAGELAYTWLPTYGAPRAGVSVGYASGDAAPARGPAGTFDVLYPNLDYFTDAPLSYPGNTSDIRPTLRWAPWPGVSLQAGADWIFRIDRSDAVLAPPGVTLVPGGVGPGGHVVTLTDVRATWHLLRYWDVVVSAVHGAPGHVLDAEHAKEANFFLFQVTGKI